MTTFEHDVAVVGAGRIGLPWASVLAASRGRSVTCVDVDEDRVAAIKAAEVPFAEPGLSDHMQRGVDAGRLRATTDPAAVADHEYVAFTLNAARNDMSGYLDNVEGYLDLLEDGQTVVVRTTLPIDVVSRLRELFRDRVAADVAYTVFPERLAEGSAIEEIQTLPKVVGVDDDGEDAMRALLEPFGCELLFTDPETAMFVKLVDNSYRDALFSIANQIAYTADELGLDAHRAIELANHEYPRNDIPTPGTVGGKCLPKDPHFLTDERVCSQPTTPDLFNSTRRTNAYLPSYVVTQVLREQPDSVAMIGLSYKRDVGDRYNSPAMRIKESLESHGVRVVGYDPHIEEFDGDLRDVSDGVDGAVLATDHSAFEGIEPDLEAALAPDGFVYDVWGHLDGTRLGVEYTGFGIAPNGADRASQVDHGRQ